MATIQIREVPPASYDVLRRRAQHAGQSLQAYLRDELISLAARPTKAEAVTVIESTLARSGFPGMTRDALLADLAADRR